MSDSNGASTSSTGLVELRSEPCGLGHSATIPSAGERDAWRLVRDIRYHLAANCKFRATGRDPKNDGFVYAEVAEWQLLQWLDIANGLASAIEARRAETRSGSVEDESATPQGDAQS